MKIKFVIYLEKQMKIILTKEEAIKSLGFVRKSTSGKSLQKGIRSYLNSGFTEILNSKLRSFEINCKLRSMHNWLKNTQGQKVNCNFWNGTYRCLSCDAIFKFQIKKNLFESFNAVEIDTHVTGYRFHEAKQNRLQIRGIVRKEMAKETIMKGVPLVRASLISVSEKGIIIIELFIQFILFI